MRARRLLRQLPNRHATAHFHATAHPIVRSFEPGEDWFYCYADDLAFEIDGADPPRRTPDGPTGWMAGGHGPEGGRVRFLLVSDLHYRLRQFDWLLTQAAAVDAVMIAGDLLDIRSAVALDVQAIAVTRPCATSPAAPRSSPRRATTTSTAVTRRGRRWRAGCGRWPATACTSTTPRCVLGDDLVHGVSLVGRPASSRESLDDCLARDRGAPSPAGGSGCTTPRPSGSPLAWDGRRAWGDEVLSGWIERYGPDLVLIGHVHQAPFARGGSWVDRIGATWVFNAGQQPGPVPARVEVDLDANTATWTSATERAAVVLG